MGEQVALLCSLGDVFPLVIVANLLWGWQLLRIFLSSHNNCLKIWSQSKSHLSFNAYSHSGIMLVPCALPCDWLQLHPSNQRCCREVRSCIITKICERICPAYSPNLLAQACGTLKKRLYFTSRISIILSTGKQDFRVMKNLTKMNHYSMFLN